MKAQTNWNDKPQTNWKAGSSTNRKRKPDNLWYAVNRFASPTALERKAPASVGLRAQLIATFLFFDKIQQMETRIYVVLLWLPHNSFAAVAHLHDLLPTVFDLLRICATQSSL